MIDRKVIELPSANPPFSVQYSWTLKKKQKKTTFISTFSWFFPILMEITASFG